MASISEHELADVLTWLVDRVGERTEGESDGVRQVIGKMTEDREAAEGAPAPIDRSAGTAPAAVAAAPSMSPEDFARFQQFQQFLADEQTAKDAAEANVQAAAEQAAIAAEPAESPADRVARLQAELEAAQSEEAAASAPPA